MLASRVACLPARLCLARARRSSVAVTQAHAHAAAAMATMPKLRLVYFNIKARAEPTRLALYIAGIPFDDIRIEHADFPAMKAKMPFAQIPVRALGSRRRVHAQHARARAARTRCSAGLCAAALLERAATREGLSGAH
jgi:hypothetical protein